MDIRTSLTYPVAKHLADIMKDAAETKRTLIDEIGRAAAEATQHGSYLNLAHYQVRAAQADVQGTMIYGELIRTMKLLVAIGQITPAQYQAVEALYWELPLMRFAEGDPRPHYPVDQELHKRLNSAPDEWYSAVLRVFYATNDLNETGALMISEKRSRESHASAVRAKHFLGPRAMAARLTQNHITGYSSRSDHDEMAELLVELDREWEPLVDEQIELENAKGDPHHVQRIKNLISVTPEQATQVFEAVSARLGRTLKGKVK